MQMGITCSITINKVLIRGTYQILAKAKVEEILVEEDEARLYVIVVINLDTWPKIARTFVPRAHIAEHWIMQWRIIPN
jgi:hypothetical protein